MFGRFARAVSCAAGSPWAFALATGACVAWVAFDRPFDALDAASALTFWMVFVIQSSQNTDTRAIQAKLDGLIAGTDADDRLRGIEEHDR